MKPNFTKASAIMVIALVFALKGTILAQDKTPDWMTQLPVKKGYVYGAGVGKSSDINMASEKARMNALQDLTNSYTGKFETFAMKCDTVLGADNKVRQVITTIRVSQKATLSGVEVVEKVVIPNDDNTQVYLLLRLDVSNNVKALQKEVNGNAKLKKEMKKSGLLKEMDGL